MRAVAQIIGGAHRAEKGPAQGRHRGHEFGIGIPVVPLAVGGIVATENGHARDLAVGPGAGAMGQ